MSAMPRLSLSLTFMIYLSLILRVQCFQFDSLRTFPRVYEKRGGLRGGSRHDQQVKQEACMVEFEVQTPLLQSDESVRICGNHAMIGSWLPEKGLQMHRVKGGFHGEPCVWGARLEVPVGEEMEYKYVIMKGYAEDARALSIPKTECAVQWECDIPNRLFLINRLEERIFVLQEKFDRVGREIFFVENKNYVPLAFVEQVSKGSPADEAGIIPGQNIISIGNLNAKVLNEVNNEDTMSAIFKEVKQHQGKELSVVVADRMGMQSHLVVFPRQWSGEGLFGCRLSLSPRWSTIIRPVSSRTKSELSSPRGVGHQSGSLKSCIVGIINILLARSHKLVSFSAYLSVVLPAQLGFSISSSALHLLDKFAAASLSVSSILLLPSPLARKLLALLSPFLTAVLLPLRLGYNLVLRPPISFFLLFLRTALQPANRILHTSWKLLLHFFAAGDRVTSLLLLPVRAGGAAGRGVASWVERVKPVPGACLKATADAIIFAASSSSDLVTRPIRFFLSLSHRGLALLAPAQPQQQRSRESSVRRGEQKGLRSVSASRRKQQQQQQHKALQEEKEKETEKEEEAVYRKVRFEVDGLTVEEGQRVGIVGDLPGMGNWDPCQAAIMQPAYNVREKKRVWSITLAVPLDKSVSYKYVVLPEDEEERSLKTLWETGGNRFLLPHSHNVVCEIFNRQTIP
mmetsp:Transcript_4710/g.11213  ORF Transcript_4710/g.11213 Transcript_4710/m.11213 type:complete len:684 (-) Transcript_4710:17-2068(-)